VRELTAGRGARTRSKHGHRIKPSKKEDIDARDDPRAGWLAARIGDRGCSYSRGAHSARKNQTRARTFSRNLELGVVGFAAISIRGMRLILSSHYAKGWKAALRAVGCLLQGLNGSPGDSGLGLDAQRKLVSDYLKGGTGLYLLSLQRLRVASAVIDHSSTVALAMCRKLRAKLIVAELDRLSRNVAFISA
jgi:hypothetical protein